MGTIVYVPNTDFQVLVATTLGGTVYSDDGGTTWMSLSSEIFAGLTFVSPTTGWTASLTGRIAKFNGDLVTAVVEQISEIPQSFSLAQNYPNPFNSTTTIQFALAKRANVKLKVFDILGREAAVLVDEALEPGAYDVVFDANGLASGVYVYRIQAGAFVETKKLTLLR